MANPNSESAEHPPGDAQRWYDVDRTTAFSDGVFAIAITLLVLTIDVPQLPASQSEKLGEELLDLEGNLISYAVSFAVIGRFWLVHHRLFGILERIDGRLTSLNLLYLAFIAFLPFPTEVLGNYNGEAAAVTLYAGAMGITSALSVLLWDQAARRRLLTEEGRRDVDPRVTLLYLTFAAIFFVSIPIAFVSTTAAELSWILIAFVTAHRLLR